VLVLVIGAILVDRLGRRVMDPDADGQRVRVDADVERARNIALGCVGAVVFIGVAVYSVFATYARNIKDPLVSPTAVLVRDSAQLSAGPTGGAERRESDAATPGLQALWGLYVGQSDDHLYVAWTKKLPADNPPTNRCGMPG
jgi:hypothetical protein